MYVSTPGRVLPVSLVGIYITIIVLITLPSVINGLFLFLKYFFISQMLGNRKIMKSIRVG